MKKQRSLPSLGTLVLGLLSPPSAMAYDASENHRVRTTATSSGSSHWDRTPSDAPFAFTAPRRSGRAGTQEIWGGVGTFLLGPMLRAGYTRNLDDRFAAEAEFDWSPSSWAGESKSGFDGYESERIHTAAHMRFHPRRTGTFSLYGGLAHNWQIDMWESNDGSRRKHEFHTLEVEAGIGNRWRLGESFIIGGDWIGVGAHVLTLSESGPDDLAHSASAIRSVSPTLHICKLSAGYRF